MLWIGNKKAGRLFVGGKRVAALYRGATLIWQQIRALCCFDSGRWLADKTWNNEQTWKND